MNKPACVYALLVVGVSVCATPSRAQPPAPALTAAHLVEQVLADNPSLAGQGAATAGLASVADVADALDDPRISVGTAPSTFGSSVGARGLLQISQTLPWPGKRALRGTAARARVAAANATHSALERDLTAQTRRLWSQWWYLHEALRLNDAHRQLLNDQLPVAQAHYASGLGGQGNLLTIQTRALHVDHQRLQLERQRHELRASINALRGRRADAALAPPAAGPPPARLAPRAQLQQLMANTHPALTEKDAALRATAARAQLARLDWRPDFRLYSGYVGTLDPASKRWQLGAEINLPFGGRKRQAALASVTHERERLQAERSALSHALHADLEAALARVDYADRTLSLYAKQIVPLVEQSLAAARSDFASARGSFAAVIEAETQLVDARLTIARSHADRFAAIADIDALTADRSLSQENHP